MQPHLPFGRNPMAPTCLGKFHHSDRVISFIAGNKSAYSTATATIAFTYGIHEYYILFCAPQFHGAENVHRNRIRDRLRQQKIKVMLKNDFLQRFHFVAATGNRLGYWDCR